MSPEPANRSGSDCGTRVAVGVRGDVTPTTTSWVLSWRWQLPPRLESGRSGGCRGQATPTATADRAWLLPDLVELRRRARPDHRAGRVERLDRDRLLSTRRGVRAAEVAGRRRGATAVTVN